MMCGYDLCRAYTRKCETRCSMKYFIDTYDRIKGSFPERQLTEGEFSRNSMRSS